MKKLTFFSLLIMFVLFSCQNNEFDSIESVKSPVENNPYKVSVDEAKNIALNFMKAFHGTSAASTRATDIEVENVEVVKVDKMATRSVGLDNGMDTLIYAVNFSNNAGYALVGADIRTEPIFGIIDDGSFSTESITTNPNFAYFLNSALGKVVYDIMHNDTISITNTRSINDYEPTYGTRYKLLTKWGQGAPYNKYCPGPYTGCVATAIAQILSYYPVLNSVSWQSGTSSGFSPLNWQQIQTDCMRNKGWLSEYSTPQSANEVAHLMRYLGVALKADYKSDGTSIKSEDAINWINDWTSLNATGLKKYNANEIFLATNAFSNKIVFMRGNKGKKSFVGITVKYTGGHAWVADGAFSAQRKSDGKFVNLYHFNWGWDGGHNGYFLGAVFNSNNPEINDSELPGTLSLDSDVGTPGDYKYNVEYSVINDPSWTDGGGMIQ